MDCALFHEGALVPETWAGEGLNSPSPNDLDYPQDVPPHGGGADCHVNDA